MLTLNREDKLLVNINYTYKVKEVKKLLMIVQCIRKKYFH